MDFFVLTIALKSSKDHWFSPQDWTIWTDRFKMTKFFILVIKTYILISMFKCIKVTIFIIIVILKYNIFNVKKNVKIVNNYLVIL